MDISGRVFVVTGGGSGLGAACARRFLTHGARVVVLDLNSAAAEAIARPAGDRAVGVTGDVTSPEQVTAAIEAARERWGEIHGVVHCAGILAAAKIVSRQAAHDLDLFRRVVEVNLIGTFNVLRLAAAAMVGNVPTPEGERGVIITTASVAAYEGQIGQAAYAAAKGGVVSLTLPAARELARHGIRVASIAPGVFETEMMAAADDDLRRSLAEQVPFPPRFGRPDEFASLAQHIVENSFLNGCVLRLDGGLRMGAK